MKKIIASIVALALSALLIFSSCSFGADTPLNGESSEKSEVLSADENEETNESEEQTEAIDADTADTGDMDFSVSDGDSNASYDKSKATAVKTESSNSQALGVKAYKITSGGDYVLSGKYENIMITVDAGKEDVRLVLDNATVTNSSAPAIYVKSAGKVTITLEDGSKNTVSDGSSYSVSDGDTSLDAAIFSKADLTINGSGQLTVNGNYKHGIVSKDELVICGGELNVKSVKAGVNGKDCVKISNGSLTVNAGSDGIRSDNDEDSSKGYIYLSGGKINVTAGNDGIQAETVVKADNVTVTIKSGSGSSASLTSSSESYKGIKAGSDILISGGAFNIDSSDDCVHSNNTVTVSGGTYTLSSGDDGIHADNDLAIAGGTLTVKKSYEGIEAEEIKISGGKINITASDDGINAAGGADSSSGGERFGRGSFASSSGNIVISGGYIYINSSGDGIDSNGTISLTGGTVLVSGPTSSGDAAFDYETSASVSGGTLIALGSSGMAENFTSAQNQAAMLLNFTAQSAGEFAVYTVIGVVGLGIKELLLWLFHIQIGWHYMLVWVVSTVIVLIWNYAARRVALYRKKKER